MAGTRRSLAIAAAALGVVVVALVVRFGSAATFSLVLALPAAGRVTAPFVQSTKAEQTAIPFCT